MNRRALRVDHTLKTAVKMWSRSGSGGRPPFFVGGGGGSGMHEHRSCRRDWKWSFSLVCAALYSGQLCL